MLTLDNSEVANSCDLVLFFSSTSFSYANMNACYLDKMYAKKLELLK